MSISPFPGVETVNVTDVAGLIANSVVGGGMLPKLAACQEALHRGVKRVRILPAAQADVLPQIYLTKLECGTEVVRT